MVRINQLKDSRDEVIRSRLLNSLGIHRNSCAAGHNGREKPSTAPSNNRDVKLLEDEVPIQRSLNDTNEEHGGHNRWPSTDRKRLVRFNNVVTEKEIASHKRYSERIKRQLWSDPEEIQENAYRNQIEFQAEGMNWQSVLENDEMYMDPSTGELIHPFWVESNDSSLLK